MSLTSANLLTRSDFWPSVPRVILAAARKVITWPWPLTRLWSAKPVYLIHQPEVSELVISQRVKILTKPFTLRLQVQPQWKRVPGSRRKDSLWEDLSALERGCWFDDDFGGLLWQFGGEFLPESRSVFRRRSVVLLWQLERLKRDLWSVDMRWVCKA